MTDPEHQTTRTQQPFAVGRDQQRYEGKLTLSPFSGHRLTASYIEIEELELGNFFGTILDTRSVNNRSLPQDLLAFNYSGVVTENRGNYVAYPVFRITGASTNPTVTHASTGVFRVLVMAVWMPDCPALAGRAPWPPPTVS